MERKIVIRKSRHFLERNNRLLKFIGLAILVLSIPLTIYVLNQVQDIRQHAATVACVPGDYFCIRAKCDNGDTACANSFGPGWATGPNHNPWKQCDVGNTTCFNEACSMTVTGRDKEKCRVPMAPWSPSSLGAYSPLLCTNNNIYCVRSSCAIGDTNCVRTVAPWLSASIDPWKDCASGDTTCYNIACNNTAGGEACRGYIAGWASRISGSCPLGSTRVGGIATGDPAAITFNNNIFVFVKGSDDAIYVTYTPDGSTYGTNFMGDGLGGYRDLAGVARSNPMLYVANGRVYVQVKGSDGKLYEKSSADGFTYNDWAVTSSTAGTYTANATLNATPYTYFLGTGITVCAKTGAVACSGTCRTSADCARNTNGCTVCNAPTGPSTTPERDYTKFTDPSATACPKDFTARNLEPSYASSPYRLAVECLNKAYCVTGGYDPGSCQNLGLPCTNLNDTTSPPEGYFGGELPTTRKFAIGFLARYHTRVINDWGNTIPPATGTIFADVPATYNLGDAIELAYAKGFIKNQRTCDDVYGPGNPYTSLGGTAKCFGPDQPWIFGFHGINRNEYFNADDSPIYPTGNITRGDFLQKLYDYGTNPAHPDLQRCMAATVGQCTNTNPTPVPVPACDTSCSKDGDCSGAKDGCTVCGTGGNCTPPAACNSGCTKDGDCAGSKDGCTVCGTGGKCTPAAACNSGCTKDGDCAGAKDGCSFCNSGGKCSPAPACGTACGNNTDCTLAAGGCNTCNSVTNTCSVAACNVSCSRDSDCAGAATKDGCVSCLGGKCQLPFNPAACKCDGMDATQIGTGQAVTFTAYSKVEGTDTASAAVKGVNIKVYRGGAELTNLIDESGYLKPTIIENSPTKIRYKTDWKYTVPADAKNGDLFRVQAVVQCVPKSLAVVPQQLIKEKSIIAKVIDKVTEPIKVVLGVSVAPTPVPPKSLQINSFYPGQIVERSCDYFHFVIKR